MDQPTIDGLKLGETYALIALGYTWYTVFYA
jgi:branched-subunit amino acid ABC-type transport system permease component